MFGPRSKNDYTYDPLVLRRRTEIPPPPPAAAVEESKVREASLKGSRDLVDQVQQLNKTIEELKNDYDTCRTDTSTLTDKLSSSDVALRFFQAQWANKFYLEILASNQKYTDIEKKYNDISRKEHGQGTEIVYLKNKLNNSETEKQAYQQEIDNLTKQLEERKNEIKSLTRDLARQKGIARPVILRQAEERKRK
jgi:chromosome segregation ATPase